MTWIMIWLGYCVVLWFAMYFSHAYKLRHENEIYSSQKDVTRALIMSSVIALFWPIVVIIIFLLFIYKIVNNLYTKLGLLITPKLLQEVFALNEIEQAADDDPNFVEKHNIFLKDLQDDLEVWNDTADYRLPESFDES